MNIHVTYAYTHMSIHGYTEKSKVFPRLQTIIAEEPLNIIL